MKEKIENILFAYKAGSMNINEASQQILDLFSVRHSALIEDLNVTNTLYEERQRVLDVIPKCPVHGKCVPYAIEWIENAKQHCG